MGRPDKQYVFPQLEWVNQDCRRTEFIELARELIWQIWVIWALLGEYVYGAVGMGDLI